MSHRFAFDAAKRRNRRRRFAALVVLLVGGFGLFAAHSYLQAQDKSGFPDGYDAVQAAPNSHKVIFENAFVRVLEVTLKPGTTEPFHHHRWPSFFLSWDTGGRTQHIRYHLPDGTVRDNPSQDLPVVAGHWEVNWMKPETMHAVEDAETLESEAKLPPSLPAIRVEIKCAP